MEAIAYYFTKDQVKTANLKVLIKDITLELQKISITVVAVVCDQGTTNAAALSQLIAEDCTFFYLF